MSDDKYNQLAEAIENLARTMGIDVVESLTPEKMRSSIIFNLSDPKLIIDKIQKRRDKDTLAKDSKGRGAISNFRRHT